MLENIRFENVTEGLELTEPMIKYITQDSQDFIWLGTINGLVRYDGNEFKIYKHNPFEKNSLKDDDIEIIYEHSVGKLLIITHSSFVYEFDLYDESFVELKSPFLNSKFELNNIIRDERGNYWIGTHGNGLFELDKNLNIISHFKASDLKDNNSVNSDHITSLLENREKKVLYIGTGTRGMIIYDFRLKNFSYYGNDNDKIDSISNNKINCIYKDKKQNLWVCTNNGLNLFNDEKKIFKRFLNVDLTKEVSLKNAIFFSICEDDQGLLWIGTHRSGMFCMDSNSEIFQHFRYSKNNQDGINLTSIVRLFKDRTNVIWIGTLFGLGKIDRGQKKFYNIKNDFNENENSISSVFIDKVGVLWIGTKKDGLYKCIKKKGNKYTFEKQIEFSNNFITGTFEYSDNKLVITCTSMGICVLDRKEKSLRCIDKNIFKHYYNIGVFVIGCSIVDNINPNIVWLSISLRSLIQFDLENECVVSNELIAETLRDKHILSLFWDNSSSLWIGTYGSGVYKYDPKENTIINYDFDITDSNSLSDSLVNSIVEDLDGNLWIATQNGLNKLEKHKNNFKRYLCDENIALFSVLKDNNCNLWISSSKGIIKFNTKHCTYEYFVLSDGILNEDFYARAYFESNDGMLYFGGNNGITYFKPDEIKTNEYIPNIVITDFQIFYESVKPSSENPFLKKSISYAKEITLTHKGSVITFEFAALIFNNPKKNEYAYKMEGFDEDWVYCGTRRTATYTNLDPGEYTFRVKGSNNDGLWNEEGTSIKVIITPPWYKTVLFKGLVGLSVIGSIGSFYRKRIQKLNKEKSQQEEFTKKLIESQENERKRVAAELHDSLGQDLLIIKNKLLTNIKKTDNENYKEQLQEISDLTSTTLDDVREISYNLRPYELDRLGLTKTIESMIERANNSTNINFVANIDNIDNVFIPEVEINIYRIIQESLNNVIKHSEAKEVIVSVLKKEKSIIINISDDGKGFDIRERRNGFGLKGIEERVKLLDGEFNIESEVGRSTSVRITFPLISNIK